MSRPARPRFVVSQGWCNALVLFRFRVAPRPGEGVVVHPGAVRGVRCARARLPRGEAVHAGGRAHVRPLPGADLLRGEVGLQPPPLPTSRTLPGLTAHAAHTPDASNYISRSDQVTSLSNVIVHFINKLFHFSNYYIKFVRPINLTY